jgi:hypothetical protein
MGTNNLTFIGPAFPWRLDLAGGYDTGMAEQNPYESPQFRCYSRPRRRARVGVWRSATIGAFLGAIIVFYFFHQPFGMGGSDIEDSILLALGASIGGYIGYSLRTMRVSPFSRS